jgi:hypothetical protein
MKELRHFELEDTGQPVSWRARAGQSVIARHGRLWLTIEGQHADIWLMPGTTFALPENARVWLSGETPGARFTLAQVTSPFSLRSVWRLAPAWAGHRGAGRAYDYASLGEQPCD